MTNIKHKITMDALTAVSWKYDKACSGSPPAKILCYGLWMPVFTSA